MNREGLRAALGQANVRAFLRVIRQGESSQKDDAYRMLFGGEIWDGPLDEHPRKVFPFGQHHTDAFGAYQIMAHVDGYRFPDTYDRLARDLGPSMEPDEQDIKAARLIEWRRALDDVLAGRFDAAISKCGKEWASLPGSPYGQPTMTLEQARLVYKAWGGKFEEPQAPLSETQSADPFAFNPDSLETEHYGDSTMAFPIIPVIQAFASLIPILSEKFGSGSEVSSRNIAAAKVIGDEIVKATNSPNLQAAFEKVQSDPEALRAASVAVATVYPELFEVGSGGIGGARKAAADTDGDWKRVFVSLPTFVIVLLMPIIYFVIWHVVLDPSWSQEIKASVVSAVVSGVLFAVVGYALGTSYGSSRKTNLLAGKE